MPDTSFPEIDEKLKKLEANKQKWLEVSFKERIKLLKEIVVNANKAKENWISLATKAKKESSNDEELNNVWILIRLCNQLCRTFHPAEKAQSEGKEIHFAPPPKVTKVNDQFRVTVEEPSMILPGVSGEIWIEPGKPLSQGSELLKTFKEKKGTLALVLGAGNQSSISFTDAIYKLFNENQVVIFKHNPVNEYLYEVMDLIFAPLIERNFFHHVKGGPEEGKYLTRRPEVDTIHMTGSQRVHDLILWETPDRDVILSSPPKCQKEFSSELGCVTPWIVVPANWSESDLDYQVKNLAGAFIQNVSFNCAAPKVVVTSKSWELREKFWKKFRQVLEKAPLRYAYYPGARQRFENFLKKYPNASEIRKEDEKEDYLPWTIIEDVSQEELYACENEAFCPIIAEVAIESKDVPTFLINSVEFCNTKIWGNLNCVIVVHSSLEKSFSKEIDKAIEELRYGSVAINIWTGVSFGLGTTAWGAFPGNPENDIQSGRGFVHNTFLLDFPQKNVLRAPFKLMLGSKYPFFPDHRNSEATLRGLIDYETKGGILPMVNYLWQGMKG